MYDHRVDIFALGVIMYELLVGKTPFDDPAVNNIYRKIKACEYKIPNTISRSASDLISNVCYRFIYILVEILLYIKIFL